MMKLSGLLAAAVSTIALTAPAEAAWRVATSTNFVVYSEDGEAELRQTITNLEKFERVLRFYTRNTKPASKLKLTIFQVADMSAVAATLPYASQGIGGYFTTSKRGPFLVSTQRGPDRSGSMMRTIVDRSSEIGPDVLQHEVTHWYTFQYYPSTYPTWYQEGFAEYWGTLRFDGDAIIAGYAPMYRVEQIRADWLPASKLLTARSYADVGDQIGSLYAQGWLLMHAAAQDPKLGEQLNAYLAAITKGVPYDKAATDSFGDLDALDRKLRQHLAKPEARRTALKAIDVGAIDIRALDAYGTALMRADLRMYSGLTKANAPGFTAALRKTVGARTDARGLALLTEAERLSGEDDRALATARRNLAANPADGTAIYLAADLEVEALARAKSTDAAAYDAQRARLVAAARAAPAQPEILEAYYDSYAEQGAAPPAAALTTLYNAHRLMPSDSDLRYKVAADYEKRGEIDAAIYVISPDALGLLQPDGNKAEREKRERERFFSKMAGYWQHETAREMLDRLEKKRGAATPGTAAATAAVPKS